MMSLTRSELEAEVQSNLGNRDDLTSAEVVKYLNLAQDFIVRHHRFSELETLSEATTTADDKYLQLPSLPLDIISVKMILGTSESRKLNYIPARWFDRMIPEPGVYTTGKPEYYTNFREVLELWRVPNDAYTIELRWIPRPTVFTAGSDVASDLLNKDDILINFATHWALKRFGEYQKAAGWFTAARGALGDAIKGDRSKTDFDIVGSRRVTNVGDYWNNPFVKTTP